LSTSEAGLAAYAAHSAATRGRRFPEPAPAYRTEFQRDRDRVVHSTAFRRSMYKTQVFVNHEGDLYRVTAVHHLTPGNKRGFMQTKMKNLRNGVGTEYKFRSEDRVEQAPHVATPRGAEVAHAVLRRRVDAQHGAARDVVGHGEERAVAAHGDDEVGRSEAGQRGPCRPVGDDLGEVDRAGAEALPHGRHGPLMLGVSGE